MLKGNRFLFFILLVLLNIFIIYIIWKKVKYFEEEFTQMISVHNISSVSQQTLYNFDLSTNPLVIDNKLIQQLNNFIALFSINDSHCVALDNKQQLFLITMDETNGLDMNSMSVSGIGSDEYPVKIVSYLNGNNYELYLLTSYGKIYSYNSLNNDRRFGATSYDNAIDICCTSVMIYLNNRGEIKNGSATMDNKYYVQLISYDNTSSAHTSGKSLFGLCTDGHLYDILSNTRKTEEPIESLNVKLICNDINVGYITSNSLYYATGVESLNNTKMIPDVKDALFIEDTIIYKKFNGDLYKFVSNSHQQLTNGDPNIFRNDPLFTGVSLNSLFIMSTVSTVIQIPPVVQESVIETPIEPAVISSCDITNDDPSCNDIFESLTAIIDGSGGCDAT